MNIRRKGAGIAFTATLLATLVATVAAPFALAVTTVTSAGSVGRASTSTGTVTYAFQENFAACQTAAGDPDLRVQIVDSAGASTLHFVGTPTVVAPGSTGPATATLSSTATTNDTLNVHITGADPLNAELITVGGLKVSADAGAATGAGQSLLSGTQAGCFIPGGTSPGSFGTVTATGVLANSQAIGDTAFTINVNAGSCPFEITTGVAGDPDFGGKITFATAAESRTVTADNADTITLGQQPVGTDALTKAHSAGEAVSQSVVNCAGFPVSVGSPVTVANAVTEYVEGGPASATLVTPGENTQRVADVFVSEWNSTGTPTAAPATLTGLVTFTIDTAGVVFSTAPTVAATNATVNSPTCSLSLDRKSCTVTVLTNTGTALAPASVEIENVFVDVDGTAVLGTPVTISATVGALVVVVDATTGKTVAFIGRVIVGTSAQPTIFIGFNDQATGMITLTESKAGFFVSGISGFNTAALCLESGETFTRAPWFVVTVPGGTGAASLQLLNPVTLVGVSQIQGILFIDGDGESCAYVTIYTSSSTGPGTIEIRGSADNTTPLPSGANNGPRLSVPNTLAPGSTQSEILVGTFAQTHGDGGILSLVSNAIRSFKNSVSIVAASQPFCAPGATDCLLGNVTLTETQNGQFKAGDTIRGWFIPRGSTLRNDILVKAGNTNDLPVVTTNASSGLLVSPVTVVCPPNIPLLNICFFQFSVNQQSFGPTLGSVTVSNIHAVIVPDAPPGPIQMEWGNQNIILGTQVGPPPAGQSFDAVVSNGIVGAAPVPVATGIESSIARGVSKSKCARDAHDALNRPTCEFRSVTATVSSGNPGQHAYVTVRFEVSTNPNTSPSPLAVGIVDVYWVHTGDNGTLPQGFPGSYTKVASVPVVNGYAYYFADAKVLSGNASLRASFIGVVRTSTAVASSRSKAVQGHWL